MSAFRSSTPSSPRGGPRGPTRRVCSGGNRPQHVPASPNVTPRRAQSIRPRAATFHNIDSAAQHPSLDLDAIHERELAKLQEQANYNKSLRAMDAIFASAERDAPMLEQQRRARRAAAQKSSVETDDDSSTLPCPATPRRAKPLVDHRKKAPKTPQRARHADGGQVEHVPVHRTPRVDVRFNPSDTSGRNKPLSARSAPREVVDPCTTPKATHRSLFPDPALLATPGYPAADDGVSDMLSSADRMSFSGSTAVPSAASAPGLTQSGSTTSAQYEDDDFASSDFRRRLQRKLLDEKLVSLREAISARSKELHQLERTLTDRERALREQELEHRQQNLQAERRALDEERQLQRRHLQTYELLLRNIITITIQDRRYRAELGQVTVDDRQRTDQHLLSKFALLEEISHQLSQLQAARPDPVAATIAPSFFPIKDTEFLRAATPQVIISHPSHAPEVMMQSIQNLEALLDDYSMGNIPEHDALDMDSSMATIQESIMDCSMLTVMDEDVPTQSSSGIFASSAQFSTLGAPFFDQEYTHPAAHPLQSGSRTDAHTPPKRGDSFWTTQLDPTRDPRPNPPEATPQPRRGDPFWTTYVDAQRDPRNNPSPTRADPSRCPVPPSDCEVVSPEQLQSTAFHFSEAELQAALSYWEQYDRFWHLVETGQVPPSEVTISNFAWPLFCDPTEDFDSGHLAQRFMVFFFHPQRPSVAGLGGVRQVIKAELMRWHPDKTTRFKEICSNPQAKALLQLMGSRVTGYLTATLERLRGGLPLDPAHGTTA